MVSKSNKSSQLNILRGPYSLTYHLLTINLQSKAYNYLIENNADIEDIGDMPPQARFVT